QTAAGEVPHRAVARGQQAFARAVEGDAAKGDSFTELAEQLAGGRLDHADAIGAAHDQGLAVRGESEPVDVVRLDESVALACGGRVPDDDLGVAAPRAREIPDGDQLPI